MKLFGKILIDNALVITIQSIAAFSLGLILCIVITRVEEMEWSWYLPVLISITIVFYYILIKCVCFLNCCYLLHKSSLYLKSRQKNSQLQISSFKKYGYKYPVINLNGTTCFFTVVIDLDFIEWSYSKCLYVFEANTAENILHKHIVMQFTEINSKNIGKLLYDYISVAHFS